MRHRLLLSTLTCCLVPWTTAWSQVAPSPAEEELRPLDLRTTDLRPVDAFVGDATVLSRSLLAVQYGLQQSAGFEQLMQSDQLDGQFVRRAGGLYAMFPASTYQMTASGYVPTIPPGTVFHIGSMPSAAPPITSTPDPSRISTGMEPHRHEARDLEGVASHSAHEEPVVDETPRETIQVRFIVDDEYRRRTILSLVWRSIDSSAGNKDQAARGPSPSDSK